MISEEMLGAYLEGNLTDQEAAYVESELALDPDLQDLADDVYANVDEAAPYELDLDDIDLPEFADEPAEIVYAEIEEDVEPDICDWDTVADDSIADTADGLDFIDDSIDDL